MFKRSLVALALTLGASTAALAEEPSASYTACMDSANTTVAMGHCIKTETTQQDARLNKAYKGLMGKLDDAQKKRLRGVQRNWISYRDANCQFHGSAYAGGTLAGVAAGTCLMDMTRERAAELERLLKPDA